MGKWRDPMITAVPQTWNTNPDWSQRTDVPGRRSLRKRQDAESPKKKVKLPVKSVRLINDGYKKTSKKNRQFLFQGKRKLYKKGNVIPMCI